MRQFLALELSGDARVALAELRRDSQPTHSGWRWLRPESIHLTLRFLGDVTPEIDAEARRTWRGTVAACRRFDFRLEGSGCFPTAGRPRVLWVGVEEASGRLGELVLALEQSARSVGFAPERRPFRPHLTVARAERGGRPGRVPPPTPSGIAPVEVGEVVLFRSDLEPGGARYTAVERFPLA